MRIRVRTVLALGVAAALLAPASADAQILKRIRKAAKDAVTDESARQVDRLLRNAIRCAVDDPVCYEDAKKSGKDVVFVDDDGAVIADESGAPIEDRDAATAAAPPEAPGEGVWVNYDFVPGDDVLFYEDFARDNIGDFPMRLDLVEGSWDVVEWKGARRLRAVSGGLLAIPLPQSLPERFTVETRIALNHGHAFVAVVPGRAYYGAKHDYRGSVPVARVNGVGVESLRGGGPTAMTHLNDREVRGRDISFRIMADGEHMKVYFDGQRVANVPNSVYPRSDTLFVAVGGASDEAPVLIGPIRVAGGGRDLYDRLARDGRVATQGILFATNSDRIRPESTPTLTEIGDMLRGHADLRLRIEGHTDSDGDDAYNQELSDRRAAAVKQFLVDHYGVDGSRLETRGFGESQPAADNATAEGKQQNRRVELVRLGG